MKGKTRIISRRAKALGKIPHDARTAEQKALLREMSDELVDRYYRNDPVVVRCNPWMRRLELGLQGKA